jgi:glutathione S-transferase
MKDGYCLAESLVLIEYVDEAYPSNPLLPVDPLLRARCRLAIDFINKSICPSFYKYLQEQDESKWDSLKDVIVKHMFSFGKQILENDEKYSSEKGNYYLGGQFTLVDIAVIPWYILAKLV